MTDQQFRHMPMPMPMPMPIAHTKSLALSQEKYNNYVNMIKIVNITRDPNWKRLCTTNPILSVTLSELMNNAKAATTPVESMLWIRSMDQLVHTHPDLLERLETTFKPLYEAARQFDIWA